MYINCQNSSIAKILKHSQQAASSSALSSQSFLPSQSCDLAMHLWVPPAPPLGQRYLLSGQAMAVQLASSEPSVQSLYPSQWYVAGMHR